MTIEQPTNKFFNPPNRDFPDSKVLISGTAIAGISGIAIALQMPQQEVPLISGRIGIPTSIHHELPLYKHPQDSVLFWTETVGAHIIEYDSVNKKTFHKEWSTEDDANIDYKANLRAGLYDKGFAARTSMLYRGPYKDYYLICIDFDGEEAFLTWCGEDYTLDSLAKWTRVDWHKDPKRIHVFFYQRRP